MPPLEDRLNVVAICLEAICLDEFVKMNMTKAVGHLVAIVGDLAVLGFAERHGLFTCGMRTCQYAGGKHRTPTGFKLHAAQR